MVKANELRIGNWIADHVAGGYFQVESIYKNAIGVYRASYRNGSIDCTIDALEEIPLTEEWLNKFGFEKIKKDSYSTGKKVDFNVFILGLFSYNSIQDNWWYGNFILENPPKYVHQLQNLYFALRGQELETKGGNYE